MFASMMGRQPVPAIAGDFNIAELSFRDNTLTLQSCHLETTLKYCYILLYDVCMVRCC